MNIKPAALSLCIILAACNSGGGGHSGAVGAPGKSAYEIWLEQGHVGTEQDFLDSLVSGGENKDPDDSENKPDPTAPDAVPWNGDNYWFNVNFNGLNNIGEYLETTRHDTLTSQDKDWDKHGGYTEYKTHFYDSVYNDTLYFTYNEKELSLGNYGVYAYRDWVPGGTCNNCYATVGYMYNHQKDDVNVYTPEKGAIFGGGTLAYVQHNSDQPTLLTGDSYFIYDPVNPQLKLFFDNYYSFNFARNNDGKYSVTVAGDNKTGNSGYNLPNGNFSFNGFILEMGYLQNGNVEEALGNYSASFNRNTGIQPSSGENETVRLNGGIGGSKL